MRETAILSRRAAAALPIAALFGSVTAAVPALASTGDAELVDLGRRWEAALAAERAQCCTFGLHKAMTRAEADEHEAIGDELHDVTSGLFKLIVAMPATTLAGLAVKGKVLVYENEVEDLDEASIASALSSAQYFVDRAALSLALDCLRIARAST